MSPAAIPPLNLSVLISGNGSNLRAILNNIDNGTLSAQVIEVISDRADARGLIHAKNAGVPTSVLGYRDAEAASFYNELLNTELLNKVINCRPDLIVLAGFMRILPARFVVQFKNRIINIHPSLLPKFKCLNTHQRALDAGEQKHGASVHWVTEGLDEGPVIEQEEVDIHSGDTAETLRARVLACEHQLYSHVIQQIACDPLFPRARYNIATNNAGSMPLRGAPRLPAIGGAV